MWHTSLHSSLAFFVECMFSRISLKTADTVIWYCFVVSRDSQDLSTQTSDRSHHRCHHTRRRRNMRLPSYVREIIYTRCSLPARCCSDYDTKTHTLAETVQTSKWISLLLADEL